MDAQFERYWHLALSRFSPLSTVHQPLVSFHHGTIAPFEQQVDGLCRRLYYLPNCKVAEIYETNRALGEKLGLNTKEHCWYYERWQGEGEGRVWVKSWNRKGREWGEMTTFGREGRKVTYWKVEETGRKIGEYTQQGSSECIKKLQTVNESSLSPSYNSEFTLKSPSSETGEKLHLSSNLLQQTKWETTNTQYHGETMELTFTDLEDTISIQEDSEEDIRAMEKSLRNPEQDYVGIVESCRGAMVDIVEGTVGLVRGKGGDWREVEEMEECLNRLKAV